MTPYYSRMFAKPRVTGNIGNWQQRHLAAMHNPGPKEQPIISLLSGWLSYADSHKDRFESGIGEDGVLGDEWAKIGLAIRGLLNGDCGAIDCGTIDGLILDTMKAEGFDPDTM